MVLVAAGWLGAALLAVLAGIAAIGVLGAGLTSQQNRPLTAAEVNELLRQVPSPTPSTAAPTPSASQAVGAKPAPSSRTLTTRAGTIVASCSGARPEIVSMSPRQGWSLHEREGDEGEFRSTSDNHDRVKFSVSCDAGHPQLVLRKDF